MARNMIEDVSKRSNRIRATTILTLGNTTVVMLLATMWMTWAGWGTALVYDLSLAVLGFIVGLLFSVPKSASSVGARDIASTSRPVMTADSSGRVLYTPNTNLEQVSDWLTKIIVGVGLVESRKIIALIAGASTNLGRQIHAAQASLSLENASALATAMLLGFPGIGFLLGFFSVRLYVSRAMFAADREILGPLPSFVVEAVEKDYQKLTSVPSDLVERNAEASSLATSGPIGQILSSPITALQDTTELITRGRAALLQGNPVVAASAFLLAISKGEKDPALFLDYARTMLDTTPILWGNVIETLQKALVNISPTTPLEIRQQVTWELMNAYLYTSAPNGYGSAIALGSAYVLRNEGSRDPYAYVYLACAYGQQYTFMKSNTPDIAELTVPAITTQISEALKHARADGIFEGVRMWLLRLATNASKDADADNDLYQVARDHSIILEMLQAEQSE